MGHGYDENTKAVEVTGTIKKIGRLFGYMGCEHDAVGNAVTISTENVDFVIIDRPGSFISVGHFTEGAGLDLDEYQVVVVKQGYLFAELRKLAKLAILALTPGATHQIIENMEYHKIIPPVYPLHITPEVERTAPKDTFQDESGGNGCTGGLWGQGAWRELRIPDRI